MSRTKQKTGSRVMGVALSAVLALGMAPGLAFAGEAEGAPQADLSLAVQEDGIAVELETHEMPSGVVGEEFEAEVPFALLNLPEGTASVEVAADEDSAAAVGISVSEFEAEVAGEEGEGIMILSGVPLDPEEVYLTLYFICKDSAGDTIGMGETTIVFTIESGGNGSLQFSTSPFGVTGSYGVPFVGTLAFDANNAILENAVLTMELGDLPEGLQASALEKRSEKSATVQITGTAKTVGEFSVPAKITCVVNGESTTAFDSNVSITVSALRSGDLKVSVVEPSIGVLYNGAPVEPAISVMSGVYEKVGEDQFTIVDYPVAGGYTVTYQNNDKPGEATATVTPDGTNITGDSRTIAFEVLPGDMTACTIEAIPEQAATGAAIEPELVVKCGENVLAKNVDYTVSYANNTAPGTATATVTGVEGKFTGTKEIQFQIALSEADAKAVADIEAAIKGLPDAATIASGDAAAIQKVNAAAEAYMALSDVAKAQISPADVAAIVTASQGATSANAKKAEQAAKDAAAKYAGYSSPDQVKQLVANASAEAKAAAEETALKANTMTVKAKTVKANEGKAKTVKKSKAFTVKKAKGKVTFAKVSGNAKITVTSKGKVKIAKGLKKGTYKVKVLVVAKGNKSYAPGFKQVTLKVKVTK